MSQLAEAPKYTFVKGVHRTGVFYFFCVICGNLVEEETGDEYCDDCARSDEAMEKLNRGETVNS